MQHITKFSQLHKFKLDYSKVSCHPTNLGFLNTNLPRYIPRSMLMTNSNDPHTIAPNEETRRHLTIEQRKTCTIWVPKAQLEGPNTKNFD